MPKPTSGLPSCNCYRDLYQPQPLSPEQPNSRKMSLARSCLRSIQEKLPWLATSSGPVVSSRSSNSKLYAPAWSSTGRSLGRTLHTSIPARLVAQPQQVPPASTALAKPTAQPFIPVIPFDQFLHAGTADARLRIARDLTHAFKTSGFAYLSQHGVSQQLIDQAFDQSAQFFELPQEIKDRLAWRCTFSFSDRADVRSVLGKCG